MVKSGAEAAIYVLNLQLKSNIICNIRNPWVDINTAFFLLHYQVSSGMKSFTIWKVAKEVEEPPQRAGNVFRAMEYS